MEERDHHVLLGRLLRTTRIGERAVGRIYASLLVARVERLRAVLLRDVLVERTSKENGTFGVRECLDPGPCVGDTRRIWLVSTTTTNLDPMDGMASPAQAFLLTAYTLTEYRVFDQIRIFVLDRKNPR